MPRGRGFARGRSERYSRDESSQPQASASTRSFLAAAGVSRGSFSGFSDADDCGQAEFDIFIGGRPTGKADAHRGVSLPLRAATPAGAVALHFPDNPLIFLRTAERHQDLIQDDIVQHLETCMTKALREDR